MTQTMTKDIFTYKGKLTFDIINDLLDSYKRGVKSYDIDTVVAKRIYAILVEGLENAFRHMWDTGDNSYNVVSLKVNRDGELIQIELSNFIKTEGIDALSDKIALINSLDLVGLNRLYRASISKARISEKGGAGLGLIEIARNSRHNLQYQTIKESSNISLLKFQFTISNNPNKVKTL